jgi:hypothetical protein
LLNVGGVLYGTNVGSDNGLGDGTLFKVVGIGFDPLFV